MNGIPGRKFALAFLLCAGLLLGAGFDPAPWKYRAAVQVAERGHLAVIPFDRALYARMRQDLADLRMVRGGEEVPFFIDTIAGSVEERECRPEMMDRSAIPGTGVRITLDLAKCDGAPRHSRIRLAT